MYKQRAREVLSLFNKKFFVCQRWSDRTSISGSNIDFPFNDYKLG